MQSLDSQIGILKSQDVNGLWKTTIFDVVAATTIATITSGYVTAARFPKIITVPAHTGLDGFLVDMQGLNSVATVTLLALEYDLGSISLATGTFTAGSSMPTKTIRSQKTNYTEITSTMLLLGVVTTAMGATLTTINLTYEDQDGNTGQSSVTNTLPGTAVNAQTSAVMMIDRNDTAIIDISAMTITANGATAGAISIYGMEILGNISVLNTNYPALSDQIFGGLDLPDIQPATPDSGSVTSLLTVITTSNLGNGMPFIVLGAVNA